MDYMQYAVYYVPYMKCFIRYTMRDIQHTASYILDTMYDILCTVDFGHYTIDDT